MEFKNKILMLEYEETDQMYSYSKGESKVMFTTVHTMEQNLKDRVKKSEPYTKAMAKYLAEKTNGSFFIKQKDNNIDSNNYKKDYFKTNLLKLIKDNNIKLLIDIHGASSKRDFDIEIGTLYNLTVDDTLLKEITANLNKNNIFKIDINNPFLGGGITQYIYSNTDIDIIQIEVNGKYRNKDSLDKLELICSALIESVNKYTQ